MVTKDLEPDPALVTEPEPEPVAEPEPAVKPEPVKRPPGTISVVAYIDREDHQALRRLSAVYGTQYSGDTMRLAIHDALAYQEGNPHEEPSSELAERLNRLEAQIAELSAPTVEPEIKVEEKEATPPPVDPWNDTSKSKRERGKAYRRHRRDGRHNRAEQGV